MKYIAFFNLLLLSVCSQAQTGSEIYLLEINRDKQGTITLTNPQNITNHIGYDNQPSFSQNGAIYYSSFNDDGRSDIRVFTIKKKTTTSLTNTTEREYSPILTPDKKFVSCIIQRDNGAQDLGKYSVKGGSATILITDLIVGYHAWIDAERVLIFVLGDPNTLQVYNVKTKEKKIIAERVGRSLHKIPNQNAMSFVQKIADDNWQIMRWDIQSGAITSLGKTLPGREDMAWTPDGIIFMSDGQGIFQFDTTSPEPSWNNVEILYTNFSKSISRLAVSPKGDRLAIVVAE